jgi:phosphoribosylaminoimidazole carboxylase
MLAASASLLNISVVVLDVGDHGPAKQIVSVSGPHLAHVNGSFTDPEKIRELAAKVDVLTVEIEHVDATVLESVKVPVHPSPSTIKIIQDKFLQKQHLLSHGSPVSEFLQIDSTVQSLHEAASKLGLPLMLKSRTLAYDGRGNFVVRDLSQAEDAISMLGDRPLYAEKWVPFAKEVAVMVVRKSSGDVQSYPVVETIHKDNICHLVFAPLRSRDPTLAARAKAVAETAVKNLLGAGVFGVEMFLMENGEAVAELESDGSLIYLKENYSSTKLHPDPITLDTILSKLAIPLNTRITSAPYSTCRLVLHPSKYLRQPC